MLEFPNPSGGTWHRKELPRQTAEPARPMADPYERDETEIRYVLVQRLTRKRVPDYEAEVLCRNGWHIIEDTESPEQGIETPRPKDDD